MSAKRRKRQLTIELLICLINSANDKGGRDVRPEERRIIIFEIIVCIGVPKRIAIYS